MPEIPEKLKWYTPLGFVYSYAPQVCRVVVGKWAEYIEVRRAPLLKISAIMMGLASVAILYGIYLAFQDFDFVFFVVILAPLLIIGVPVTDAVITLKNSQHWKGPLRFRYDARDGKLFFPRENATYQRKDCQRLILGCVRGYDKRGWSKKMGVYYKVGTTYKRGMPFRCSEDGSVTQIFILVLDEHNKWHRHDIADDWAFWRTHESGSKQFVKLVNRLHPLLECEVFVKDYSVDECFAQQNNSNATH